MKMSRAQIRFVVILLLGARCHSFKAYQANVPNGDRVPHPCIKGTTWDGLGHLVHTGSGARNPFGRDFGNNGNKWTKKLCEMDSDGDGRTNGMELGDPLCEWKKGGSPKPGIDLTHPGVCEPFNSDLCKDKNKIFGNICKPSSFDCPQIDSPDVKNFTLKFPRTKIPNDETNYYCLGFDLSKYGVDVSKDYHLIATQIRIGNSEILHHVLYYQCRNSAYFPISPEKCDMAPSSACQSMIGGWTVGAVGECYHPNTGFRMGRKGFTKMSMQFHWNNPEKLSGLYDESGVTFYYTEKLRRYDATVLTVGREGFSIPPKQPEYVVEGTCSPKCSRDIMKGTVNIVGVINHMHYMGRQVRLELKRQGGHVITFAKDEFNYDNPKFHIFETPIKFKPGDELKLFCGYSSLSQKNVTKFGASTKEEMCYSFLTIYPGKNLHYPLCVQPYNCNPCSEPIARMKIALKGACNITRCEETCPAVVKKFRADKCAQTYFSISDHDATYIRWNLQRSCDANVCDFSSYNNTSAPVNMSYCLEVALASNEMKASMKLVLKMCKKSCEPGCEDLIRHIMNRPCFTGKLRTIINDNISRINPKLYASLHSCDEQICGRRSPSGYSHISMTTAHSSGSDRPTILYLMTVILTGFVYIM